MILGTLSATLALSLVSTAASAGQCTNERWNKVMKRGKIVIGVKADYKPWGYRNTAGGLVGMEIDMAKDVAWKWFRCSPRTGCSSWNRAKST